jgi:hypothetical protein
MLLHGRHDVHQHLWPPDFVEALRARTAPPRLREWTLYTEGGSPYRVRAADHDLSARRATDAGAGRILLSMSAPLGVESLPARQAQPLLDAWHRGVLELGRPFAGWASVHRVEPDLDGLDGLFSAGFAGLQVAASDMSTPTALERLAPVLQRCAELGRPVLVHPGPVLADESRLPAWWPAVVSYTTQMQAAWWAWQHTGRSLVPELRICFAAGAGLAPVQHERFTVRGGGRLSVDRATFVETSSFGRQGVDALIRALGIDVLVLGSDRPYAEPFSDPHLGEAAQHAIQVTNPNRLLQGGLS